MNRKNCKNCGIVLERAFIVKEWNFCYQCRRKLGSCEGQKGFDKEVKNERQKFYAPIKSAFRIDVHEKRLGVPKMQNGNNIKVI